MNRLPSLSQLPQDRLFRSGDVFVLFGELFGRGYATGLVHEARAAGMEIIGITVGRREKDNTLRPLTDEELAAAEAELEPLPEPEAVTPEQELSWLKKILLSTLYPTSMENLNLPYRMM